MYVYIYMHRYCMLVMLLRYVSDMKLMLTRYILGQDDTESAIQSAVAIAFIQDIDEMTFKTMKAGGCVLEFETKPYPRMGTMKTNRKTDTEEDKKISLNLAWGQKLQAFASTKLFLVAFFSYLVMLLRWDKRIACHDPLNIGANFNSTDFADSEWPFVKLSTEVDALVSGFTTLSLGFLATLGIFLAYYRARSWS
jgi:hypothetical protein